MFQNDQLSTTMMSSHSSLEPSTLSSVVRYIRTVKRSGQPQRKRVCRERSRLQQQHLLQQLCEEYADGARNMQQFLRAVGHTIRFQLATTQSKS